ncbi:hypothetical protein L228DRAFT_147503 [Xylona heveae TC161]|uniref:Hyaluronan/mRNA-binding protein domain-containing protein n=1 Tax=Xylona heveae (strain CBS 132557 / TC161) TaxID=1328760 RepID=A0A165GGI4_XYLHT|nr:hypothetical protein L228DRAFT_147503 [Xylona heveae TC161]KZF22158.1 hypothetical protein L228DRAFT_147503 [Xylona heveae TC161]
MSGVASKNLYELLGNDPEQDSDREPEPPTQAIDKPVARTTKRNAPDAAPKAVDASLERPTRGGRRGDAVTGSERAFRDRQAGSVNNRSKPTDDGLRFDRHSDRLGGGRVQQRGGRGGPRGARGSRDDRHSRTAHADTEKQIGRGWGASKGENEWVDEKAGEAMAKAEEKEGGFDANVEAPVDAEGHHPAADDRDAAAPEPEAEDKSKSYADYLAEQLEKKASLGGIPEARKVGEAGDKKSQGAKKFERGNEEEYMSGVSGKQKREKERKAKVFVDIDHSFHEAPRERPAGRGGRGGPRGGGERGGRGRGAPRGGAPRGGARGGPRGGAAVNVADQSAFPSLGA